MLSKKQHHFLQSFLLSAALGVLTLAVFLLAGCAPRGQRAEDAARSVMTRLFSCTVEEAEEVSAVLAGEEAAAASEEPGLTSSDDGLTAYADERYGDLLSEECLQQMLGNRSLFSCAVLVQRTGQEIQPEIRRFDKREGEEAGFDFTIDLKADGEADPVATATGNIFMEQTEAGWKASAITLSVGE